MDSHTEGAPNETSHITKPVHEKGYISNLIVL